MRGERNWRNPSFRKSTSLFLHQSSSIRNLPPSWSLDPFRPVNHLAPGLGFPSRGSKCGSARLVLRQSEKVAIRCRPTGLTGETPARTGRPDGRSAAFSLCAAECFQDPLATFSGFHIRRSRVQPFSIKVHSLGIFIARQPHYQCPSDISKACQVGARSLKSMSSAIGVSF